MTIFFCNKEPIDLNAIAVMGVSVKVGTSPIGYFGTGLKFAIATLLRSQHEIILLREGERIVFTSEPQEIRGETFARIVMNGERLGFTTALGRNWKAWQAYRELACNCMDEDGVILTTEPAPGLYGTVFAVTGDEIEMCHLSRGMIFLDDSEPLFADGACEIHEAKSGFPDVAFYRGVRAHTTPSPCLYSYNVITGMTLTEDRTIRDASMYDYRVASAIAQCKEKDIIQKALLAPNDYYEARLRYSEGMALSAEFLEVVASHRNNGNLNQLALQVWIKSAKVKQVYERVEVDAFEEAVIANAIKLVARAGKNISRDDFIIAENLGSYVYGLSRGDEIAIARRTLDRGVRFTASTLYEELLHRDEHMMDGSRDLQDFLLDKLFSFVERAAAQD